MSPMLMIRVPKSQGTSIHSPSEPFTCRPGSLAAGKMVSRLMSSWAAARMAPGSSVPSNGG
ncbi:hypothetical protein D3C76_1632230 [compost metagenome]